MPSPKPTILVKKSDGTSVRMIWDEFQIYMRNAKDAKMRNEKEIVEKKEEKVINDRSPKAELPAKIGEEALATTAPVKDIFVDEAKYARTAKNKTQNTINKTQRFSDRMQNTDLSAGALAKVDNRKQMTEDQKIERLKDYEIQISKDQNIKRPAIEMVKKDWTADDGKSLLENVVDEDTKNKTMSILPSKRDDLYDLFIREIRFAIKDELRGRLNSLAVSFVKGVRTEDQTRGYLHRSEADGGLGFSEEQTLAVIGAIKKIWHLANTHPVSVRPGRTTPGKLATLREGGLQVPSSEEGRGGVRTHPSPLSERGNLRSIAEGDDHKFPPRRRAGEVLAVNAKPLVQDVAPPKPRVIEPEEKISMGPIDEIASMTLTDFRRLATGGNDSIQVLRDKFSALRKESVIIYFQALDAWFASPVYKDYQNLIKRAVNERRKLQEVAGESEIKFEEFIKLANLCSSL